MIEKTIKTLDGKLRVKIPTKLHEVTLGQLMAMQEKPELNDLDAISILSGIDVTVLKNVTNIDDIELFADHVLSLSQQIKHLYNSDDVPGKINFVIDGKTITVKVINNLSIEPVGAFMAARDVINDEIKQHLTAYADDTLLQHFNPSLKACCTVLGHYFFCRVKGKRYNEYEAEEFCNTIKNLKATEALPIAKYFFTCYPSLSKRKITYSHRIKQFLKKSWRTGFRKV